MLGGRPARRSAHAWIRWLAAATAVAGTRAQAQPRAIALCLRPHAGDTVRTRFEQTMQFVTRGANGKETAIPGLPATGMTVLTRSVVEQVDALGAVVTAITDSVSLDVPNVAPELREQARHAMQGRRSRLRIAPDGAMTVVGGDGGGPPAAMRLPGTLPPNAVAVGATWTRTMPLPWKAAADPHDARWQAAAPPRLDATFRLDSLARNGMTAYVSMRGAVHAVGAKPDGAPSVAEERGAVTGTLTVDLMRGWVTESRTAFTLDGTVTMPAGAPGTTAAATPVTRPVQVRITQHLRAM